MTDTKLVKELRETVKGEASARNDLYRYSIGLGFGSYPYPLINQTMGLLKRINKLRKEAADRIEALTAENAELKKQISNLKRRFWID